MTTASNTAPGVLAARITERRESAAHALEREAILKGLEMMNAGRPVAEVDEFLIATCAEAEGIRTGEGES